MACINARHVIDHSACSVGSIHQSMAGTTGLEPATSAVTVIHPNLSYRKQKHGRLRKALKNTPKHTLSTLASTLKVLARI